jgi:hypothetical protein
MGLIRNDTTDLEIVELFGLDGSPGKHTGAQHPQHRERLVATRTYRAPQRAMLAWRPDSHEIRICQRVRQSGQPTILLARRSTAPNAIITKTG